MNRRLLLMLVLATAVQASVAPSARVGYRSEFGVESKANVAIQVDAQAVNFVRLDAGLSLNLFQNAGVGAAALGIGAVAYDPIDLTVRLAVQHQQWNDWQAGENRVLAILEAVPLNRLDAGFGLVARAPVFGDSYSSPSVWKSGAAEWNYVYRLRWKFIQRETWWLRAGLSSYDRYTAHTPQQFPFEVDGAFRLREDIELVARAGTAIVGYSGGLVSFHEFELDAGARYEF